MDKGFQTPIFNILCHNDQTVANFVLKTVFFKRRKPEDGDWGKAKKILSQIIEEKTDSTGAQVGDGPSVTLMGVMEEYNFVAPSNWKGFRELTEK